MKTSIKVTSKSVLIHHGGKEYNINNNAGTLEIPPEQIDEVPETVALILVLSSGSRRFYLPRESYFALRERIWMCLDRKAGGINSLGEEIFAGDEAVMEASRIHRAAMKVKAAAENGKNKMG